MSSYIKTTVNPDTHAIEEAEWLDDYFGSHEYGVRFPSTGVVYRALDFEWTDDTALQACRAVKPTGMVITKEQTPLGKRIQTMEHADGRKDVTVEVNTLDVNPEDEATAKAKQVIEEQILPAVANQPILVTVIYKPTNDNATFTCARKDVRKNAEELVKLRGGDLEQYILVQNDGVAVTVTTL